MTSSVPPGDARHYFTVDVEEYFHANALESVAPRTQWERMPCRLEQTIPVLLEQLRRSETTGTFFVLGWVARRSPQVVREIAEAGHEVASHGYWHRRVTGLSPAEFRDDVRDSKHALEDLVGRPVYGYRAPSFSIVPGLEWAFDILLEEEFRYDSSVFPIRRPGYGYPDAPRDPHAIQRPNGTLDEYPLATTVFAGMTLPAAGGGYLRQLPLALIRRAFREATARGAPATFYVHPWEIDPGQPRLPVSAITRLRHYRGLSRTLGRIERLLREFRFTSIASARNDTAPRPSPRPGADATR
jgi:polysaccharide deacetylase family protein (PEP-CTERM system associated)